MSLIRPINSTQRGALISLVGLLICNPAHAGGLYISEFGQPNQGASNAGAGALAEDASTAFQNPAGIMFLDESKWMVSGLVIDSSIKFKQDAATGAVPPSVPDGNGIRPGSNGGDAGSTAVGGGLFYARPVNDKWGWGLSVTSISGAVLEYEQPQDFAGRYWATEVDLLTINVAPAFSYKVTDDLSLGLSIPVMFASLDMDVAIPGAACIPGPLQCPEGLARIKDGDDISATISVSTLWQATSRLRLGALYMGKQDLKFDSDLEITLPTGVTQDAVASDVEFTYPQMIRTWAAQEVNDKLTLMASLAWEDWSSFDNITISTPIGDGALPRNWDDTWHFALGLRWRTEGPWTFYTGVGYDTDPTQASDRTADMPIDEQWRLSGGTTYQFVGGSKLGVSVTYADYGDAKIDNGGTRPISGLPWNVNGKYDTNRILFVGVNYGW
jgi:long-chain fatty acid transport protein